jgi:hypothetical protein
MEIWDILLKKFTGLYFASPAGIVDGGGDAGGGGDEGGGDPGGGDEGGGDDGAIGDDADTDGSEGDVGDEGDGSGEGEEGEESGEGEGEEGEEGEHGAKKQLTPEQTNKAVEKALAKMRATDPEGAKLVRKEFFKARQAAEQFRQFFPTPQEAQQASELVDRIGGQKGFERAKVELDSYARELDQMAKGDPKAIEDLARDFPKGLAKLVPHALDKLRTIDEAAYGRTLSRHMAGAMAEKGFTRTVERLQELIADGKVQPAFDTAKKLLDWIREVEQFGKAAPAEARGEEMSEVERRAAEVDQKENNLFTAGVASDVTTTMNSLIAKQLNPILKGKNLSLAQRQSLASGIYSRIASTLQRNEAYQERLRALLDERDRNGAKRYVGSQVARLVKKATDAEWAARGFTGIKSKKTAAAGNGTGAGAAIMGKKPAANQIDWSKDRSKMRYMTGEATLLKEFGGRVVRWDRNAL